MPKWSIYPYVLFIETAAMLFDLWAYRTQLLN